MFGESGILFNAVDVLSDRTLALMRFYSVLLSLHRSLRFSPLDYADESSVRQSRVIDSAIRRRCRLALIPFSIRDTPGLFEVHDQFVSVELLVAYTCAGILTIRPRAGTTSNPHSIAEEMDGLEIICASASLVPAFYYRLTLEFQVLIQIPLRADTHFR